MIDDMVQCIVTSAESEGTQDHRTVYITLDRHLELYVASHLEQLRRLQLDHSGRIEKTVRERLRDFEHGYSTTIADKDYPIHFSSAGTIPLIENASNGIKYLLFVHRTPPNPRLTALAGHSSSISELENPMLTMERESIEEALIYWGEDLLLPLSEQHSSPYARKHANRVADLVAQITGEKRNIRSFVHADDPLEQHEKRFNPDQVNILRERSDWIRTIRSTFNANAIWNPEIGTIELVRVPYFSGIEINELRIFDTETHDGEFLKRDHVLVPIHILQRKDHEDPLLNKCLVMNGYEVEGIDRTADLLDFKVGMTALRLIKKLFD